MNQADIIETLTTTLSADSDIRAVGLIGSFGRGDADAYSDVDMLAVAANDLADCKFAEYRQILPSILPILYIKTLKLSRTINGITPEWQRFDITFTSTEKLDAYAKDQLKILLDRDNVLLRLPAHAKPAPPSRDDVAGMAEEFLRVFGLLPVAIGREDYVLAQTGAGILRGLLIQVMIVSNRSPHWRGVLSLHQSITDEQYQTLKLLPVPCATRKSVIEAHLAIASHFLPIAKSLLKSVNGDWPAEFEACTLQHVEQALGVVNQNLNESNEHFI